MTRRALGALAGILTAAPVVQGTSEWYTFKPSGSSAPGAIGMQSWIEKPAGKHGRIMRKGSELVYNGKPLTLWGLNLCYGDCAPDKTVAEKRAALYTKYGINAVRLHKYADGPGWRGIQVPHTFMEFDPEKLDRLDYQIAQFRKAGIFVKLSATFGVKLGPADTAYVPFLSELGELNAKSNRIRAGYGAVYLSRELQDMQSGQMVNLLRHRNPYTKLTYAEDPAIAVIEIYNEDSALWFGTMGVLKTVPTLRTRTAARFTEWLLQRYGGKKQLLDAWGPKALNAFAEEGFDNESVDAKTVVPAGNPWFYDPDRLTGSHAHLRTRLLDTMRFLYELQCEFNDRYIEAVRKAGYEGEILGSNWQAGRAFSHYYNLHADYRVGLIDRHNYFGGGKDGAMQTASMLSTAGSGMLSAGMQQVKDRPFMLSEWIHVFPTEWGVEGPAIIGAYGMGLQGWDVSFMFQNGDNGTISERIGEHRWDVTAPQIIGVFPAVARQVLRGDVRQAELTAERFVHVPSLHEGSLGFNEMVTQKHDVKSFDGDEVSSRALAVARCVVTFTDTLEPTAAFDLSEYARDGVLHASTGQLAWKEGTSKTSGFFTIDTDGTKAVVGFARGQTLELGRVRVEPQCRFCAVYVTAQGKDETIETAENLLLVAIGRARNTGMKVDEEHERLLETGTAPVIMEPVAASITIDLPGKMRVELLDHDGMPTGKTLPVKKGAFAIDGAVDKTPYYLISKR